MPRPPILPVPDRKAIFESGLRYADWLEQGDSPDNSQRMREIYAELELPADIVAGLAAIDRPVYVIAIAESWCGDVVRHTPVLAKMADACAQLQVRFVSREQYPDFFARFLTNGGEAIPKYVFCAANFNEVGNWGPMPATPRKWIAQGKACDDVGAARKKVGAFYTQNANRDTMDELLDLCQIASFRGFA